MLKKIGIGAGVVLGLFLAYVAAQPSEYTIVRELAMQATAEKIFPYLNNMKLADQWGPWKEADPETAMQFQGPEAGVGSKTFWEGGKKLGTGSATIVESEPNLKVKILLEYTKPMPMTQDSWYLIRSEGGHSVVTWKVTGKNNFMGRVMCVFVNMDKMVGGMFEKGLSNLKAIVEKT